MGIVQQEEQKDITQEQSVQVGEAKQTKVVKENPIMCYVDSEFLKFMHKIDYRVSVKYNNRVFAGVITNINNEKYVIPLTSQITEERLKEGKKKRSALITTFVQDGNEEIANLLYNNMIPITEAVIEKVIIDPEVDTYCANEIRYIRKHWDTIEEKAKNIYTERYDKSSRNYNFLSHTCCNYKKLEQEYPKFFVTEKSE